MAAPSRGPIRAVLFDMDGLLLGTEEIYTTVVNEILAPYNKTQSYAIKARLMGTPERVATEILLSALWPAPDDASKIGPDCPFTVDNFLTGRNERLEEHFRRAPPLKGAVRLVKHLEKHDVPMCVATGSKRRNFELKSGHNGELFDPFGTRVICGDDARLQRGKPTPDIFLLAAREGLGVPEIKEGVRMWGKEHDGESSGLEHEILVFEDAKPGVQAAKAAGMKVIWVPDPNIKETLLAEGDLGADEVLDSLLDFRPEAWGLPPFDDEA